jgi:hypothetical protein
MARLEFAKFSACTEITDSSKCSAVLNSSQRRLESFELLNKCQFVLNLIKTYTSSAVLIVAEHIIHEPIKV